jgi:biopolymer transport protein ExbB
VLRVIYETWEVGGVVLIPIALVGFWGLCLVFSTWLDLGTGLGRADVSGTFEKVRARLAAGDAEAARREAERAPGLVKEGISIALKNRALPEPALRSLLAEHLSISLYRLERHLPLVRVMGASAPLLGLLGTVRGLIHTFQVMTEYGNGNAVLLAHGISEALIATQTGLLLAIVLILLGQRLEGRVQWLQHQVEHGVTSLLNQIYRPASPGSLASSASPGKGGP